MSNYPPGVTGCESQITGAWQDECADCGLIFTDESRSGYLIFGDELVCNECVIERIRNTFPNIDLIEMEELLKEHNQKGKQMKEPAVQLIDYTGAGTEDPARHAANVLVFTKQTRLEMEPTLFADIARWPWERIEEELKYMANTIPSSWEFVEYKFLINNVTRGFTHQFVRTRTGAYAQQTMRVLNVHGWSYGTGPTLFENGKAKLDYDEQMARIAQTYDGLIADGVAIEDARGILPTNIHTNIVAKFDLRTLANVARKRASSRTQGEYRHVLNLMLGEVVRVHPWAALFLNRTFDKAARELELSILKLKLDASVQKSLVKLIDQLRATA